MLFKPVQTRLQMLFFCFVLGCHLCKGVFDPNLMVICHRAPNEKIECLDRLNKVVSKLSFLFLSQIKLGPLKVCHVIEEHFTVYIDADEVLLAAFYLDELSKDQYRIISVLLQRLPSILVLLALFIDNHLLNLVLANDNTD